MDVESLSVDVGATGINRQTSTNDTPVSIHRSVSFTITHVRDKDTERRDESILTTSATTEVRISDATMVATLFLGATKSNVVGEDAGTHGSARISPVSSATEVAKTTMLGHERTTQPETEREQTVSQYTVLESTETMSPEGDATSQIVSSTGRAIQQESESDDSTQLLLSSEHTTRSSILFTTDHSSDPLHTSAEATTESLPLTITTASQLDPSSTGASSAELVSVEIYPTEYAPVTESPSVEIVVTYSVTVKDMSRTTPVWSAITDSLIRIGETTSHPVQNAVSESTIVDNPFTGSHRVDNTITEGPRVDNAVTESHIVDNAITKNPHVDNAITESHLVDNAITESHLVDNAITESHLVDNAITESHHVDTPITETHHVDNAVTESPSSAIDATESITTGHPRNGSDVTASHLTQPTNTHSLISTQWKRIMIIRNRTKDTPTASLTSEMTLSTADNASNFRMSTASEIEDGVNTTKQTDERTHQALQSNNFYPTTKIDDVDSTNGGPFTVTIESHTLTGMTHNKTKSSNS